MTATRSSSYHRPPSRNTAPRQGGRGLVHSVQVLGEASGLPELCIKVAKPRHCRSLAREAWYSRLETLQGNAIPRCGFSTVPINWKEYDGVSIKYKQTRNEGEQTLRADSDPIIDRMNDSRVNASMIAIATKLD
ncbi:uncharacterized protein ARMOST_12161 [Armillaria ostoyae]|uniref:Uncharacterized protein n=1 Tax=Armillaria ostoyae TaxID=47428 RepID=A0A284RJ41_ARMOS|nr:uncharacterized protein ARMOST_12161 [Armillaria ostoyae]